MQSTDDQKLEAALTRGGDTVKGAAYAGYDTFTSKDGTVFAAVHDGSLLVSNSEAALHTSIDVQSGTGDKLSDATAYKDALAALPKDNLAVGYVDGSQLATLAQLATSQASSAGVQAGGVSPQSLNSLTTQLKGVQSIGLAITPEDQGVRFSAVELLSKDAPASMTDVKEFTPTLESSASGDSYVYIGFQNLGPMLETALKSLGTSQANLQQTFAQLQTATGISFENDLVPLLSGEHAITVGPGLPVSAALLLKPADAAKGEATLRKVTAALAEAGRRDVPERERRTDHAGLGPAGRLAPRGRPAGGLERPEGRRSGELVARGRRELEGLPEGDRRARQRHRDPVRQRRAAARPGAVLHELVLGLRQGGARQRRPRRARRGLGHEGRRHDQRRPVRRDHEVASRLSTGVAPGMIPARRA